MPAVLIILTTIALGLVVARRRRGRARPLTVLLLALMAVMSTYLIFCNATKTEATPAPILKIEEAAPQSSGPPDAGVLDPFDPGCTDPKTCGEPRRPDSLDGGLPDSGTRPK